MSKLIKELEAEFVLDIYPALNHEWCLNGNKDQYGVVISQYVPKTLFNRWKWWISTKLFLPGSYKWIEDKDDLTNKEL